MSVKYFKKSATERQMNYRMGGKGAETSHLRAQIVGMGGQKRSHINYSTEEEKEDGEEKE